MNGYADAVVQTRQLTKVYANDVVAVDRLDLEVRRGEIFGLLGPNGAGKTTTAGMLTGRVRPTSGSALLNGIDVWQHPGPAKRFMGVVTQDNTLDRALTVYENLWFHGLFFGMTRRQTRQETDRLLSRFNLSAQAKRSVASLSGGMARRLMLARAVMHRPQILFLDEPSAGLDPRSRLALWELLMELNSAGQTVLLSTHYLDEAERLCGRIAIMEKGVTVALDTPAGLKRATGVETELQLMIDGPQEKVEALCRAELKLATFLDIRAGRVRAGLHEMADVPARLILAAHQAGLKIRDLSVAPPTLETVFLRLTGKEWD